jgi:hypothetical protein
MSSCIPNETATIFFYGLVIIVTSVFMLFASRIFAHARTQANDKTIFDGSLFLVLVGVHRAQRRNWNGPTPSAHDRALLLSTRRKLMWLSLAVAFVGVMLLASFNSQTCWLQNLRSGSR